MTTLTRRADCRHLLGVVSSPFRAINAVWQIHYLPTTHNAIVSSIQGDFDGANSLARPKLAGSQRVSQSWSINHRVVRIALLVNVRHPLALGVARWFSCPGRAVSRWSPPAPLHDAPEWCRAGRLFIRG